MSIRSWRTVLAISAVVAVAAASRNTLAAEDQPALRPALESIRERHDLPALAAAVIRSGRVVALDAVGVRKYGDSIRVTADDKFHIGSDTKAMTATLLGVLVDEGKLKWETKLEEVFPEWAGEMSPGFRDVTVEQILTHRGGFPARTEPKGKSLIDVHGLKGSIQERRTAYIRMIWREAPEAPPGARVIYSNAGYTVAGAIAERVVGSVFEELLKSKVLTPLGIKSAGFGAMGTPGKIDQPWQHAFRDDRPQPIGPGPFSDNPAAISPAGRLHCSIGDWARFVSAHTRGEAEGGIVKKETFRRLHTPVPGGDHAMGWIAVDRDWGGGRVLTHAGSNTMNFAVVWVAPKKDFAVLIATNQGGDKAQRACDEVAGACIQRFLPAQ